MVAILFDNQDVTVRHPRAATAVRRPSPAVAQRRRRVAATLALMAAFGLWLGVRSLTAAPSAGLAGTTFIAARQVVVQPGDTLWSIAGALDPHGDERALVDELSAEVHGQPLQVGETLTVP